MRVFKTKWFVRFSRRQRIEDSDLCAAIERDNIDDDELTTLKEIAVGWLEADSEHIETAIKEGFLQEVPYGERK